MMWRSTLIALAAVALMIASGCGDGGSDDRSAREVFTAFAAATERGDFEEACGLFTQTKVQDIQEDYGGDSGPDDCPSLLDSWVEFNELGHDNPIRIDEVTEEGTEALVLYDHTDEAYSTGSAEMERTDEGWRISDVFDS